MKLLATPRYFIGKTVLLQNVLPEAAVCVIVSFRSDFWLQGGQTDYL